MMRPDPAVQCAVLSVLACAMALGCSGPAPDEGEVETGAYDELMAADGLYRRLVSRQLVEG